MATGKKTSIRDSTRRKGENRIAQQAALKAANARAKDPNSVVRPGEGRTKRKDPDSVVRPGESESTVVRKGGKRVNKGAKRKQTQNVQGLAQRLRSRFPK